MTSGDGVAWGEVRARAGWLARAATVACVAALCAVAARADGPIPPSPYLQVVPPHGACDVIVTEANAAAQLTYLNLNGTSRVFCVRPGDYRGLGTLLLTASGTAQGRRYLRFDTGDPSQTAIQRSARAIFEEIRVAGGHWVIQGLTLQPRRASTRFFLSLYGTSDTIVDGNLFDGRDHPGAHPGGLAAVVIGPLFSETPNRPSVDNTVQRNVMRNGNPQRDPVDYTAVAITGHRTLSNDGNRVLDNEIIDWGDGVAVMSEVVNGVEVCTAQRGTVIDGNDIYLTAASRVDCTTGAPSAAGGCACAENAIDIKNDPGPDPDGWTRITNNRTWGFRPTYAGGGGCGGSGSTGQAITAGNHHCPGHVLVANNVVSDAAIGINPAGSDWIVAGNLLHDIRAASGLQGSQFSSMAIDASSLASDLDIEFNTIVGVDTAYDDGSDYTIARCNAVIGDLGRRGVGEVRGTSHQTTYNYLYDADDTNFVGTSNRSYASASASSSNPLCYWRRRWTGPEEVCVPRGATTAASPHAAAYASCDPELAAALGLARVGWPAAPACNDGVDNDGDGRVDYPADPGCSDASGIEHSGACGLGAEILPALAWLARRRRRDS